MKHLKFDLSGSGSGEGTKSIAEGSTTSSFSISPKLNLVKKSESGGGNSGLRAEKIASPFHTQISSEFS